MDVLRQSQNQRAKLYCPELAQLELCIFSYDP
jgi:hypothetical protein